MYKLEIIIPREYAKYMEQCTHRALSYGGPQFSGNVRNKKTRFSNILSYKNLVPDEHIQQRVKYQSMKINLLSVATHWYQFWIDCDTIMKLCRKQFTEYQLYNADLNIMVITSPCIQRLNNDLKFSFTSSPPIRRIPYEYGIGSLEGTGTHEERQWTVSKRSRRVAPLSITDGNTRSYFSRSQPLDPLRDYLLALSILLSLVPYVSFAPLSPTPFTTAGHGSSVDLRSSKL